MRLPALSSSAALATLSIASPPPASATGTPRSRKASTSFIASALPRQSTTSGWLMSPMRAASSPQPVSRRTDSACRSHRLATSAIGGPNRKDRVRFIDSAGNPVITSLALRQP